MNDFDIEQDTLLKLNTFDTLLTDGTIITGGHFMLKNNKPVLNTGTIASFKIAVQLYKLGKTRGLKVGLGILVNDFGMTCGANACYAVNFFDRKTFSLPKEYLKILEDEHIENSELNIFWEKQVKNRASLVFRTKLVKMTTQVKKIDDAYWLITKEGDRLLLIRNKPGLAYGMPACPLIMGMYALEQRKKGWISSINFWYVDIDNYENIPNHFMIEKGVDIAHHIGIDMNVKNIYFTHDKVIANF